ncbi:hypothetical protein COT99_04020 [Candidatus Falkowbacteria bacterium CG10_big_fil_rev_8_21_14_0_10_43_10]|uniref:Type IV pilus modification protein PilV n=1 Tax=Candidatus Falkowbacteria bacterium CG10_big_fil_rev_8_21_14_0_10_43_10 TaxID=1974567 RepID=A0A2H0V189_9BACT|nr:MAG: hypothetical protein COT99_04020 [Candidatus Falkowbacteria bacterium CG10_big_fil_rev_8_21_14_0_10_43_10]
MAYGFNKKGFSILEVMISITIISVGMVGLFSLIIQNSKIYSTNKNKFIAVMLAQEGIELTRNIRDSNWLDPLNPAWDDNINSGGADGTFVIDYAANPGHGVNEISGGLLYLDSNKRYTHTAAGNTATHFYRLITISTPAGCDIAGCFKVNSKVEWSERGKTYDFQIDVFLYDWRE